MERGSLISIIVPIYNAEKFLKECIISLIQQSYKNLEIILINDGSKDSSGTICDDYAKKDKRIKVIHKQNEGVSIARNIGLDVARGKYIGFVDSDDICELDMFEKLYYAISESNVDIALCMFSDYVDGIKKEHKEPIKVGKYDKNQIINEIIMPMVGSPITSPQCAPVMGTLCRCIFKYDIINISTPLRMKNIKIAEDLLFDIEYLCRCQNAIVIGDALYNYRMNESSATHLYITDLYNNICIQMKLMKDVLIKENLFSKLMEEHYAMTVLYNLTWCISNETKRSNLLSKKEIIKKIKGYRNLTDYKKVLKWSIIKNIKTNEKYYFLIIKLKLYHLVFLFNRKD